MPTPDAAVDKILDIYIDDLLSTGHDAGWHGGSISGRMIEYGLITPETTGKSDKMLHEIRHLRRSHPRYQEAKEIIHKLDKQAQLSTLCQRAYNGKTRLILGQYIKMTPKIIAQYLKVSHMEHLRAVHRGRKRIKRALNHTLDSVRQNATIS